MAWNGSRNGTDHAFRKCVVKFIRGNWKISVLPDASHFSHARRGNGAAHLIVITHFFGT